MAAVNALQTVSPQELIQRENKLQKSVKEEKTRDFGSTIKDFITTVDEKAKVASGMAQDVIQGKSGNLHEAMAALEESGLSFKLMVEIRNKLLESYKEIERMSV